MWAGTAQAPGQPWTMVQFKHNHCDTLWVHVCAQQGMELCPEPGTAAGKNVGFTLNAPSLLSCCPPTFQFGSQHPSPPPDATKSNDFQTDFPSVGNKFFWRWDVHVFIKTDFFFFQKEQTRSVVIVSELLIHFSTSFSFNIWWRVFIPFSMATTHQMSLAAALPGCNF